MNISGLGASGAQNAVGNNAKDLEQEIKKLEQKKAKLQQDKAKAENPFSTAPSKEAAEIDKKIKELDKQIQQLKAKAITDAGNQNNQPEAKSKLSDEDHFDKITLSNKQPNAEEKSISGVYNVLPDENGSKIIALTPFEAEKEVTKN